MGAVKLVCHHIPKTAGTYLLTVLKGAGLSHHRSGWADTPTGREDIDAHPDVQLHTSHWAFHPSRFTPRPEELYLTWVRHPVDMAYSAYAFFHSRTRLRREMRPHHLFERIGAHDTLESYIDAVLASPEPFYPEGVFTGIDLSAFDFVGSVERMTESLRALFSRIDKPVPNRAPVYETGVAKTYRREALEARLQPEIEAVRPWL